jgi:hypothetical protein
LWIKLARKKEHAMDLPSANVISAFLTPVITAGAAVLAVIIGNRLSYARTYKEKLWDLKRPAYGTILSELAAIEQICDSADRYIEEDSDRYFETIEQKHNVKIFQHFGVINKRIADDYLILSEEFIALYVELTKEMSGDPNNTDPPEDHEKFAAAIRKYRPLLIDLARSEMTLRKKMALFIDLG